MTRTVIRILVLAEVVVAFALPAYMLLWGLFTLPLWIRGAIQGAGYAAIDCANIVGGCLGVWALVRALRFCLASQAARKPNLGVLAVFGVLGLVSWWSMMTANFKEFTWDGPSVLMMVLPTLVAFHIAAWTVRRARRMTSERSFIV
jgi:hypothetical protein